jgi:phage tail sheath gpL-like
VPVNFNRIPDNLRVPLFWAEFDPSQAGYLATPQPAALLGHKLAAGTAPLLTPLLVTGVDQALALFGQGSMLADMVDAYRANDPTGELWCVAVAEAAGTKADQTVTFTGTPTAAGTVAVYIGDRRYALAVTTASTPTTLAQALDEAIAADLLAPVTCAAAAGVATLSAQHPGELGAALEVGLNLGGVNAGEYTPAGLTVTVAAGAAGTGVPDIAPALTALGDAEYDFVGVPWSDAASLDDVRDAFSDATGRWAWDKQLYGHAFSAKTGTVQALHDFGVTRNDPHCSLLGYPVDSPSPPWRVCAAFTAEAAVGIREDPARPLQTLPLIGITMAPRGQRFTVADSQTLLYAGIATASIGFDGVVRIQRAITTYQKNAWGQADPSWLDVQTPATLQYLVRTLRNAILTKFPRHKLANDGTRFGAGQAIVTPKILKAELIAQYSGLMDLGMVENMEAFKTFLIVERDATDPNRVNVLLPPDLVNQLRIFAALVQFRLQYSAQAVATAVAV